MENKPAIKRNVLGGQMYVPKTEEERKKDIAKMEAESRRRTEQLRQKEGINDRIDDSL